jgi:MEDS: MEthanogen/methylotroph, DcmR Sensory domain
MDARETPRYAGAFDHAALLYSGEDEYLSAVAAMADEAAAAAAPLHVAVPGKPARRLPESVRSQAGQAVLADMADLGRNPARLIPYARSFAADFLGERVYCLWEPAWRGRSAAELREVARHETLCNLAFGGSAMSTLCLYDTASLGADALGWAERTHPVLIAGGYRRVSACYLGAGRFPAGCDDPLDPPGPGTDAIAWRQPPDSPGGHGLWLVNELCDLAERRTGPAGTTTRLHMRRRER